MLSSIPADERQERPFRVQRRYTSSSHGVTGYEQSPKSPPISTVREERYRHVVRRSSEGTVLRGEGHQSRREGARRRQEKAATEAAARHRESRLQRESWSARVSRVPRRQPRPENSRIVKRLAAAKSNAATDIMVRAGSIAVNSKWRRMAGYGSRMRIAVHKNKDACASVNGKH